MNNKKLPCAYLKPSEHVLVRRGVNAILPKTQPNPTILISLFAQLQETLVALTIGVQGSVVVAKRL